MTISKWVWLVLGVGLGLAIIWVAGLFIYTIVMLRGLLHVHVPARERDPRDYGLEVQTVRFSSVDGTDLAGWWMPVENPRATVILVHGYTRPQGGKPDMLPHAQFLHAAGYQVLLPDLRSFGDSAGERITLGRDEWQDVQAAYDWVIGQPGVSSRPVGFLGLSMGAAAVVNAVGQRAMGDFVILQSPYSKIDRLFDRQIESLRLPLWAAKPVANLVLKVDLGWDYQRYDPDRWIGRIDRPLLVLEALRDEALPLGEGERLFELATGPKEMQSVDATHNMHENVPGEFAAIVLDFLERHVD